MTRKVAMIFLTPVMYAARFIGGAAFFFFGIGFVFPLTAAPLWMAFGGPEAALGYLVVWLIIAISLIATGRA